MKTINTLFIAFLGLGIAFACSTKANEAQTNDESAIAVQLHPVETRTFSKPILSAGIISTPVESRLSFKIGGVVNKIYVQEGESVKKGQLLASLNLTEIEAQLSQAKYHVQKLNRDLARVEKLYAAEAATLEQVQNLKTALAVAEDQYQIAAFNRDYATIKAGANGKILKKLGNEGELIAGGSPLFILNEADEDKWIVKVGLPDTQWLRLKVGDSVSVTTDAFPNHNLIGKVSLIGEGTELGNGLYPVEIKILKTHLRLASGLFAQVHIYPSDQMEYQVIPIESLVQGKGKKAFVYVPTSNQRQVEKRSIEVAFLANHNVYVGKGLEGVSQVINAGSAYLTESSVIQIINPNQP